MSGKMNSKLSEAIAKVRELPEAQQEAIAELVLDFVEHAEDYMNLSPEQLAELDRRLDANDIASDEEVQAFFARFKA